MSELALILNPKFCIVDVNTSQIHYTKVQICSNLKKSYVNTFSKNILKQLTISLTCEHSCICEITSFGLRHNRFNTKENSNKWLLQIQHQTNTAI